MVKIIARRSLGLQPVYDLGLAGDHNFGLAGGWLAANCFNKSHSAAYGYVTYQTAFLKANYPVEYMAALLTANSGDRDKVQMYIASCLRLGIDVEPPDINRSGVDFTPLKGPAGQRGKILFGLGAIRNLGAGAIDCLLRARNEGGPFKSLGDLCDRVDLRAVNRRALESLIQCGALDCLQTNRHQLVKDLELVVEWASGRAKDRASGQGSLLDLLGGGAAGAPSPETFESAPKAPPVEDYAKQERLNFEKEMLGFYISDHPLKALQASTRLLGPLNLSELGEFADRQGPRQRGDWGATVSAIVMVVAVKLVTTKKGDRMAVVQLEDLTGQAEGLVFPKWFDRLKEALEVDARLMIWGKVDRRDDQVQFVIEDAEPIDRIELVTIDLPAEAAGDIEKQHHLRNILKEQSGEDAKTPVLAAVVGGGRRELVRFGPQFRVRNAQATAQALQRAGFTARSSPLAPAQNA